MAEVTWAVTLGGQTFELELRRSGNGAVHELTVNGRGEESGRTPVSLRHIHGHKYLISLGNRTAPVFISKEANGYRTVLYGHDFTARVEEARLYRLKQELAALTISDGPVNVTAPMPGLVLTIEVTTGDEVREGDGLVVVESMKMENEVRAPAAGIVDLVAVEQGAAVDRGALLVRIIPGGAP